jgi:hypothetical protein
MENASQFTTFETAVSEEIPGRVSFEDVFNEENMGFLLRDGYTIIEHFFADDFAHCLLSEMQDMAYSGKMLPNKTHFVATPTKVLLFSKPHIFEVDL